MIRSVALWLLALVSVVATASIWLRLLDPRGNELVLAAIACVGAVGSALSFAACRSIAMASVGARSLGPGHSVTEIWLVRMVRTLAVKVGIRMPDVAVYDSPDINSFSIGVSKNRALVVVSTGLLSRMPRVEASAVLAHEISHIASGDMVTLGLIQSVLNTFVVFPSAILGGSIDHLLFRGSARRHRGPALAFVRILTQLAFGLPASVIVAWFSRRREFRADSHATEILGDERLTLALAHLKSENEPHRLPESLRPFGVHGALPSSNLLRLLGTHPALDERIRTLRRLPMRQTVTYSHV